MEVGEEKTETGRFDMGEHVTVHRMETTTSSLSLSLHTTLHAVLPSMMIAFC